MQWFEELWGLCLKRYLPKENFLKDKKEIYSFSVYISSMCKLGLHKKLAQRSCVYGLTRTESKQLSVSFNHCTKFKLEQYYLLVYKYQSLCHFLLGISTHQHYCNLFAGMSLESLYGNNT